MGAKVVGYARTVAFQTAKVAIPKELFGGIYECSRVAASAVRINRVEGSKRGVFDLKPKGDVRQ